MATHENIKRLRELRGMSQTELAEKTGYKDRSSIAKIEAGLVDLSESKISSFASALNVSPAELMFSDSDGLPSPELVATVLKSLHLEQYLREHGYLFADDLEDGDIPDKREYCYEQATGRLWLLPAGKVHELEASIDRFTDFSIADLLRDAVEIPRTDPRYAAFPKD